MISPLPSRPIYGTLLAIGLAGLGRSLSAETSADFQVEIKERTILISGSLPDDAFATDIEATLASACPNHEIAFGEVVFAPKPGYPSLADLRPLLAELGISTMEGRLEIWQDRIVLGGLTDSQVTLSALTVRLRALLTTRRLVNHLCIVATDDLPKPHLLLAAPPSFSRLGAGGHRRTATFETSGVAVHTIPDPITLLEQVENFSRSGPGTAPSTVAAPLPAAPIEPAAPETVATYPTPPAPMPLPGNPVPLPAIRNPYAPVGMILFSRNTALFQGNQEEDLADLLSCLESPTFQGQSIRLEAIKASGASAALLDYMCERRLDEATALLTKAGIDKSLISHRTTTDDTAIDSGEVRVTAVARLLQATPMDPATEANSEALSTLPPALKPQP